MSDKLVTALISVITAVIGVSIVSVLVSNGAQTSNVISAATSGFANVLKAAVAPVSSGGLPQLNGLSGLGAFGSTPTGASFPSVSL